MSRQLGPSNGRPTAPWEDDVLAERAKVAAAAEKAAASVAKPLLRSPQPAQAQARGPSRFPGSVHEVLQSRPDPEAIPILYKARARA